MSEKYPSELPTEKPENDELNNFSGELTPTSSEARREERYRAWKEKQLVFLKNQIPFIFLGTSAAFIYESVNTDSPVFLIPAMAGILKFALDMWKKYEKK